MKIIQILSTTLLVMGIIGALEVVSAQNKFFYINRTSCRLTAGAIMAAPDGMLMVGTYADSGYDLHSSTVMMNIDTTGKVLRSSYFSNTFPILDMQRMRDSSIIIVAIWTIYFQKYNRHSPLVLKLSPVGTVLKALVIDTSIEVYDASVTVLSDGTLAVASTSRTLSANNTIAVVTLLSPSLEVQQQWNIIDTAIAHTHLNNLALLECADSNLLLLSAYEDVLLSIRLTRVGQVHSMERAWVLGKQFEMGSAAAGTDGGYLIVGTLGDSLFHNNRRCSFITADSLGHIAHVEILDLQFNGADEYGASVFPIAPNEYIVAARDASINQFRFGVYNTTQKKLDHFTRITTGFNPYPYFCDHPQGGYYLAGYLGNGPYESQSFWMRLGPDLDGCYPSPDSAIIMQQPVIVDTVSSVLVKSMAAKILDLSIQTAPFKTPLMSSHCGSSSEVAESSTVAEVFCFPSVVTRSQSITIAPIQHLTGAQTILVRDLTGKVVYTSIRESGTGERIQVPTAHFASGVYIIELQDPNSFASLWRGKVVVE